MLIATICSFSILIPLISNLLILAMSNLSHISLSLSSLHIGFLHTLFLLFFMYTLIYLSFQYPLLLVILIHFFILSFCFSVIYFFAFCFLSSLTLPPVLFHEYLSSILCYVLLCMSQALIIFSTISQFFLHSHI